MVILFGEATVIATTYKEHNTTNDPEYWTIKPSKAEHYPFNDSGFMVTDCSDNV